MASILRPRQFCFLQRCVLNQLIRSRNISTSKKNSDTATAAAACEPESKVKKDENWVSYGFDYNSKEEDTNLHNATFFFGISLCIVFGSFVWAYAPDPGLRDWASREAFLELRRREQAGEPPISPDYVSPATIVLPTEDELNSLEIII